MSAARRLEFIDESLRDGPQSLWASRIRTETMLGIAPTIDRTGFAEAVVGSAALFEIAVRTLHEDPWERLRLLRAALPSTPLRFLIRGRNLMGWRRFSNDVAEAMVRCLRRAGIDWIMVFDGLNDIRNIEWYFRVARDAGVRSAGIVCFTESPVHGDQYFVDKARELITCGVDSVLLYDASGVLTPSRTRTLIPALMQALNGAVELEVTVHSATGQSAECLLEAVRLGARKIFTASLPVAYGDSIPATIDMVQGARALGVEVALDERRVREVDDYFYWVAYKEGKPLGRRVRFDPAEYAQYAEHQVPGGMMSNLVRQLSDLGLEARLPAILEEAGRVRREIGYPVMVTPMSQLVGVQATLNVVEGERYRTIPHELRMYARGYYGQPAAPLDPNALDRILGDEDSPIDPTEHFLEPTLEQARAEDGPFASDEELLLSVFYGRETMAGFQKQRKPIVTDGGPTRPLSALIRELSTRRGVSVAIEKGPVRVAWETSG